jgi:hypothetical protein
MIDEQHLREGLQRLLRDTEAAIRERISDEPSIEAHLRERHAAAVRAGRTAGSASGYNSFADEAITQSGVHWLLGCVFVRFLEDNGWLDERNKVVAWLAGPGERLAIAKGERTRFLRPDPTFTDRDYLLYVFREVARLPGTAGLFDSRHNPLFQLGPTAQGAAKIVEFFQRVDPDTGGLVHDFTDPEHGTRFLGDLYQNLSESARKRYALCQTPGFVIDFILDRTLTPAIDTFGLEQVRMIDPSCGSGHFLLAAFARLFRLLQQREPATNPAALAQRALDAVHGVDLNPFAAEISRFRLLIAALEASGVARLRDALDFRIKVAAGDSLLHGRLLGRERAVQYVMGHDPRSHYFAVEDGQLLEEILGQQYHVVVGNPPYIFVPDDVLRGTYRARYGSCFKQYQLGVPFTERFFDLTLPASSSQVHSAAGFVGMIVSNAFMKRSLGKKLIEEYIPHWNLTHVVDTSGVYLPGHGTPTAILFGRHEPPVSATVRAVRGIRGETSVPAEPAKAPVWSAIVSQIDQPDSESPWVSVSDAARESFHKHPWSIGGGGAAELKELLDEGADRELGQIADEMGRAVVLGEDDAWPSGDALCHRSTLGALARPFVCSDDIRDWFVTPQATIPYPYDGAGVVLSELPPDLEKRLWPVKCLLERRTMFKKSLAEMNKQWFEYLEHYPNRLGSSTALTFAFFATHNNFAIDKDRSILNRSAPVITLSPNATQDEYIALLGILNSSVACFWLKQVCYPKGGDQIGDEGARVRKLLWDIYYEIDTAKLKKLPLPAARPLSVAKLIQSTTESFVSLLPLRLTLEAVPTIESLAKARDKAGVELQRMIAFQEELDWRVYYEYGLVDEDLSFLDEPPGVRLGERAFEFLMARRIAAGEIDATWFERHRSTPVCDPPLHWSVPYLDLVKKRIGVIHSNRDIALIEQPEYKRRWHLATWDEMEQVALKNWLLDRIEVNPVWQEKTLLSCGQLRDALARDANWVSVAEIYTGRSVENLDDVVTRLTVGEGVPYLPVQRYTETGLRKRVDWEQTWDLQRRDDSGNRVGVPGPPKYRTNDFQKPDYWRLRGGLDVPKERFILYPQLERDADRTPVLGWAGWNHLDQAKALAGYCQRMRTEEGWEPERLKPILAGLLDLKPWLLQWHNELDRETGVRLGEYFVQFAENQCQELGFSPEEVAAWRPAAKDRSRPRTRRTTARRPQ